MNTLKKHIALTILILGVCITSHAQIKTNVTFSHTYLDKAKAMNKSRKEYKRYVKDSVKRLKKLNKRYDFKMDSLMEQIQTEAGHWTGIALPELERFELDSLKNSPDSLAQLEYQRRRQMYISELGVDSSYFSMAENRDSLRILQQKKLETNLEARALEASGISGMAKPQQMPNFQNQNELGGPGTNPLNGINGNMMPQGLGNNLNPASLNSEQLQQTPEELRRLKVKQDLKKKMSISAKTYISKYSGQAQKIQSKMTDLKKKYTYMPNSNDLSTAVKHTSLKGTPVLKRFFTGGNINIKAAKPLVVDLAPQLGYRINKLWEAGISGTYRKQFGQDSTSNDDVYGYSAFVNFKFYKGFFSYLEAEQMSIASIENDVIVRSWKQALLLGIGREINIIGWLNMHFIASVNLLHNKENDIHGRRVVFKTGFRLKK